MPFNSSSETYGFIAPLLGESSNTHSVAGLVSELDIDVDDSERSARLGGWYGSLVLWSGGVTFRDGSVVGSVVDEISDPDTL